MYGRLYVFVSFSNNRFGNPSEILRWEWGSTVGKVGTSTPCVRVRLLGPVCVERGGAPARGFESRKALGLLCYLAMHGQPVPRARLAELFWEGLSEDRGRGNLSRVLHNVSEVLPSALSVERRWVWLPRSPSLWVDIWAFEELQHKATVEGLGEAATLFRGDVLADLEFAESLDLETWVTGERELWRQRHVGVLARLVHLLTASGRYEDASSWTERWLGLDPLAEDGHRQLMTLLAAQGRRSAALAQYDRCRVLLAKELGVEPEDETTHLFHRLRRVDWKRMT